MFHSNLELTSENEYKQGYQEGADDVLIAFSEIVERNKSNKETYEILDDVYKKLCKKFPYPVNL
jgi:hypothetical protein